MSSTTGDRDRRSFDEASDSRRVLLVDASGAVIASFPITATSLPLPANAAKETGGNLATIASKDFATQTTLAAVLAALSSVPVTNSNLDIALSAFKDALRGANSKTLSDIVTALASVAVTNAGTFAVQNTDSVVAATLVTKTVDFTASQTAQTIWTPANGKKFVITDYDLSFSAAGAITVFDGTDDTTYRVFKMNGATNGGAVHAYRKPRISAAANNVLKYTTGAGAAGSLTIHGYEV